ncbi:MAG: 3-dehydroquinate synthase II [Candidatus Odinarchaeota archaeon]
MSKEVWVDLSNQKWPSKKEVLTTALERGISTVILDEEDIPKARKIGQLKIATYYKDLKTPSEADFQIIENVKTSEQTQKISESIQARRYEINSNEDVLIIKEEKNTLPYFIISAKNWKVIPLENLIAEFQNSRTKLIAEVNSIEEAKLFLQTLEKGVDGVLLKNPTIDQVIETAKILKEFYKQKTELTPAKITVIKQLGAGDRVCIDTCSILRKGEGILVGSQSKGLFLVHSESLESEYVASRPFRVNAGPVHSYVLTPGNKTKYLSELKAGDEILVVSSKGETFTAIIGRVKIEVRPLILVEAEVKGETYKIILQNAETIRLVDSKGEPVSITQLKVGDQVLLNIREGARHFGTQIQETIIER